MPDLFFTKDGGAFDKGHLVRRDDVCWGPTLKDIQKANGDTYHTTNCTPQTGPFNQSAKGEDNWGDLENLIQKETKAERAIVFAGPVLAEDDRLFDGRDENGSVVVRIPQRFWKIVVVKSGAKPQAFGFVLEQDLSDVPPHEEFIVPPAWKRYMVTIEDIEAMLFGFAKLDWLKQHDQFDGNEAVRIRSGIS
jgi:endonuclease G